MNEWPLRSVFYIVLAMAVMVGVVAVAACGGSDDNGETTAPAAGTAVPSTSALTGTIAVAGSSTVFPISEAVAEEFSKANPKVTSKRSVHGHGSRGAGDVPRGDNRGVGRVAAGEAGV